MSTPPSSPAAGQANTLLCRPGVGIVIGFDQVLPSLVEKLYFRTVSPVTCPAGLTGACSQTAYRFPALSMAIVGKLAPVLKPGKLVTGRSTQSRPLGSLTLVMAGPNATGKQRPIRILLSDASSWMT